MEFNFADLIKQNAEILRQTKEILLQIQEILSQELQEDTDEEDLSEEEFIPKKKQRDS